MSIKELHVITTRKKVEVLWSIPAEPRTLFTRFHHSKIFRQAYVSRKSKCKGQLLNKTSCWPVYELVCVGWWSNPSCNGIEGRANDNFPRYSTTRLIRFTEAQESIRMCAEPLHSMRMSIVCGILHICVTETKCRRNCDRNVLLWSIKWTALLDFNYEFDTQTLNIFCRL